MKIPRYLLLIGAMKAGTSALYSLLSQHPEIAGCREKEPGFLSQSGAAARDVAGYEALWDFDPHRHSWAMEGSTAYTKLGQCPSAALSSASMPADFRFVMMVRDPIARTRSEYLHCLAAGWRKNGLDCGISPASTLMSNYSFQLAPYLTAHRPEQILVQSYPEFRANPLLVGRRVLRFLGLPDAPLTPPGPVNAGAGYRSVLAVRLLQQRGLIGPAVNPMDFLHVSEDQLEAQLNAQFARAGCPHAFSEAQAEIAAKTQPTHAQIERLHQDLDPDLERFQRQWGIDPWMQDGAWVGAEGCSQHFAHNSRGDRQSPPLPVARPVAFQLSSEQLLPET